MKKRVFAAAAVALTLAAGMAMNAFAAEDITIAGIVFQDDQFMNLLTKGYEDAAADAGVTILTQNTNNDAGKEVELITTYLTQDVDGVVIAPLNEETSVAALQAAAEQGLYIALTNIDLSNADFIVAGYTSNDYLNCHDAGLEAAEILKEKGLDGKKLNVATLQFASQFPDISNNRVTGYLDALTESGIDYEVVANQDAWMPDTAIQAASDIITANADIDVIIAANEGGTIGAAVAVQNANLADKILVFGHDGSDQISSMILDEENPLQSIVAQDPYTMGYNAATALIHAIQGEDYSETKGKCQYVPGVVLSCRDKDAVNTWREANGYAVIE